MDMQVGDKIKVRLGAMAGKRGLIRSIEKGLISTELEDGTTVIVQPQDVTNLSRAARLAWRSMPKRQVGRRRGTGRKRVVVSIRIDQEVWQRFKQLEAEGAIADRSTMFSDLLRAKLEEVEQTLHGKDHRGAASAHYRTAQSRKDATGDS